jgi:hypothetical protein
MARRYGDWAVNAVIVVTCIVVASAVLAKRSVTATARAPAFSVGEAAESLPAIDYGQADRTVVLYVRSTCKYCTASMPFYRHLNETIGKGGHTRLVVVSIEDPDVTRGYLQANDLQVSDRVQHVGKANATPTLLVVGRDGKIGGVWVGKQPPEEERSILAMLVP